MKIRISLAILVAMLLHTSILLAQVTIGSNEVPASGALLQLKDVTQISDDNANSSKGLMMPRMELNAVDQLFPMFDEVQGQYYRKDGIDFDKATEDNSHRGLMVFNVKESDELCRGLHVWDGNYWVPVKINPQENVVNYDPATGILKDIQGNSYTTGTFGTAGVWMTQNLRQTKYLKCGELRDFKTNTAGQDSDYERQFGYPNLLGQSISDPSYYNARTELGLLYNWCAATNRINATSDEVAIDVRVQGICPAGWHIPSIQEYVALINEINQNTSKYASVADINAANIYDSHSTIGSAMQATDQPHLATSYSAGKSFAASDGGFAAYALGYGLSGVVDSAGKPDFMYANFWTSNNSTADKAVYVFSVHYNGADYVSGPTPNIWNKKALFPVRCKKN